MNDEQTPSEIRTYVREHYGQIAQNFQPKKATSCGCQTTSSQCCPPTREKEGSSAVSNAAKIYETPEAQELPDEVAGLSMGCGDPITLAELKPGQTVLDLGSGGGIDCFLAAKKVGPTGHVIGVDMTAEMIDKARANQARMGFANVEFRLGEIEHLPVADNSVDVIISNCVINLSPDKPQVFREAFRVLKPGGKLAISDVVTDGPLPDVIKESLKAWAGCVAGAMDVHDYLAAMREIGFVDEAYTPVYFLAQTAEEAADQDGIKISLDPATAEAVLKAVFSARITARKP